MIAKLEPIVPQVAGSQLALIAPRGECEFVKDFAMTLPGAMYCGMIGFDPNRFGEFIKLSIDLIFGATEVYASDGAEAARAFRAKTSATIDGTDSTAAIISYAFRFLAEHPLHRQKIIDNPSCIPAAATELIRFHGFHHSRRQLTRDANFAGVDMKNGDIVLLPIGGANHDERKYPDPCVVDFERDNAGGNLTFGAGIHRCIGQFLATLQLRIALEEFHAVIPEYRLDPVNPPEYMSSQAKVVYRKLPLLCNATT